MSDKKPRFRKERLDAVLASAMEAGAEVTVDLVTGVATITPRTKGGARLAPPAPVDEGERLDREMREKMGVGA